MSPRDFCYFLRGLMEANDDKMPTPGQWDKIVSHLKLVMEEKEKPTEWPPFSPEEIEAIQKSSASYWKTLGITPPTISCGPGRSTLYC